MEEVGKYMWSEEGEFMSQFFANCNTRDHHVPMAMACKESSSPTAATSWFDGAGLMYHEINNVLVPMAFPDHNAAVDVDHHDDGISINSLLNMNDFMGMDTSYNCTMENSTTTHEEEYYCNKSMSDHDHDHVDVEESNKKKKKRSRIPNGDHIPPPVPRNSSRRGGVKRTKVVDDEDDKDGILNNAVLRACSEDGDSMITSNEASRATQRAGRGSATDPQSLYARKRRERINERLKILQKLIPNGTKVDISTMLEEAVEYVKFLQLQIKLLSSDDHWMFAPIAYNGMDIGALDRFKTSALKLQS